MIYGEIICHNIVARGDYSLFIGCNKLKNIEGLNTWDTTSITNASTLFNNCSLLTDITISNWNLNNATNLTNFVNNCSRLNSFKAPYNINVSMSNFNASVSLSVEDLLGIINNLNTVTTTQTLTIGGTNLAKLTAEQIKIATDKNWTVV